MIKKNKFENIQIPSKSIKPKRITLFFSFSHERKPIQNTSASTTILAHFFKKIEIRIYWCISTSALRFFSARAS